MLSTSENPAVSDTGSFCSLFSEVPQAENVKSIADIISTQMPHFFACLFLPNKNTFPQPFRHCFARFVPLVLHRLAGNVKAIHHFGSRNVRNRAFRARQSAASMRTEWNYRFVGKIIAFQKIVDDHRHIVPPIRM
jgi:hypothetical protein